MNREKLWRETLLDFAKENINSGIETVDLNEVTRRVDIVYKHFEAESKRACAFFRWLDDNRDKLHPDSTVETAFASWYKK